MIYIVIILTLFSIWALVGSFLFFLFYKERAIDKLKYYDEDYIIKIKLEKHNKQKKGEKNKLLQLISSLAPNFKLNNKCLKKIELDLIKADIQITVEQLLIIKMFSSLIIAFLIFAFSEDYFILIISFLIVWNIPRFIISSKKKERVKLFDSQLNEGIVIISNSLKAGHSFLQAVAVVTEETKDPFAKEFKKLLKEMSLGIPEEDTFENLLARMESEDLKLVINAILIQKDVGGNLSEILDNISETIIERQKIKNELKTLTAQGKLSGVIVTLIPVFLGLTIYILNKEYILLLFNNIWGLSMIITSTINQVLGILMIRKIVNIDL